MTSGLAERAEILPLALTTKTLHVKVAVKILFVASCYFWLAKNSTTVLSLHCHNTGKPLKFELIGTEAGSDFRLFKISRKMYKND